MSMWNYVVTAHKPTNVTHSCVGNFTSPQELNLIIAKCTRIEIHLLAPHGLQGQVGERQGYPGRDPQIEMQREEGHSSPLRCSTQYLLHVLAITDIDLTASLLFPVMASIASTNPLAIA
ncbi:hypothetical protein Taro_021716 [Colocasia esculenta]|uniref:Uncharacterized protein n=1 Tax=Colocasia esculenta TaxID=4460 RepID=A0A843V679_COLES|nr:hypothetical protein [Colocasia esculenta]